MKTILAVWHSSGKGKTESIREFTKALLANSALNPKIIYDNKNLSTKWDFRMVIEANGKIIGIRSAGDPPKDPQKELEPFAVQYNCDIIICSSRTRGITVKGIERFANQHSYDIIWTSTYQSGNNHPLMNQIKGQHMLDLLIQADIL